MGWASTTAVSPNLISEFPMHAFLDRRYTSTVDQALFNICGGCSCCRRCFISRNDNDNNDAAACLFDDIVVVGDRGDDSSRFIHSTQ